VCRAFIVRRRVELRVEPLCWRSASVPVSYTRTIELGCCCAAPVTITQNHGTGLRNHRILHNPESWDHPQSWTGDSDEDYEQSCRPNRTDPHPDPTGYACRPTKTNPHPPCPDAKPVRACLFSCLRLAAPLSHLLPTARTWLVPPLTRWRCCRYIGPPGVPLLQLHVPVLAGRAGAGTVPDADSPRIRHVLLLATQSAWKTKNARHLTRTVSEQHTLQFLTHTHWPHVTCTPQVREQHSSRVNGRRTSAWRWAWVVYSDCR
jgi:hypothetical protein